MISTTATTILTLLLHADLFWARAQALPFAAQLGNERRQLEKGDFQLFQDDTEYWTRLVDETANSVATAPTPAPPIPEYPVPPPTQPPVPAPDSTPPPTPEPTGVLSSLPELFCDTEASVTCLDLNGVSCDELVPPTRECETGSNLETVRFRLEVCTCEESSNTQEDFLASCSDGRVPFPASDEVVRVTCLNIADNSLLFSNTILPGDYIVISAESGQGIADSIGCSIFTEIGDLLQSLTIDTSGQDDLYLNDKYGSLTLEGCNSQQCAADVSYTYTVENTGNTDIRVTKFERARNGEQEELLLPDQMPFNLAPGESRTAGEEVSVDLCVGSEYFTVVEVEAVPPVGDPCPSEADYFFPILDGCLVDVQITCKTEDGVECSNLVIPAGNDDCLVEATYRYEIINVGTGVMAITTLERTRNEETLSLMDLLSVRSLNPGEAISVVEKETFNVCEEAEYYTDIVAEADPPNGLLCFDEEMYKISTASPCEVSVDMSCSTIGGLDCEDLQGEESLQCSCPDGCATTLVYRYTAASCVAGLDGCVDSGTNELAADIVISNGGDVLFEGRVQIEDDIIIRNGDDCLPDALQVLVSPTGDQPVSQVVLIDSSCGKDGDGVSLLDNFGAFEFVGYSCVDGGLHSCYVEVEYIIVTSNTGALPQRLTEWAFELSGELRGPGIELPTLASSESFTKIEPAEVELCGESEYAATAAVTSTGSNGNDSCEAKDEIEFGIAGASTPNAPTEPPNPSPIKLESIPFPGTAPPSTPEEECVFQMSIDCVPQAGSNSCNATPPRVDQCSGLPFEMGFLYNGGDCSNSWNVQETAGKFFCNDFNGGPPTERGEKSLIIVTDLEGETIFHNDYVAVGSMFTLFDSGNEFPADQLITIYSKNDTGDPTAVLQSIQYHSSCSQNLFLKDRFGAAQLVLWVNEDQGVVSCFANQTFTLYVTIPIDIEGGPATVQSLTVTSNVDPFFFNLTENVFGIEANGGEVIQASIALPIELTEKRTYNMVMTLTAETAAGASCTATNLVTFTAGHPLPPIFPTFAPTVAPDGL